jgi:hypothetical protein
LSSVKAIKSRKVFDTGVTVSESFDVGFFITKSSAGSRFLSPWRISVTLLKFGSAVVAESRASIDLPTQRGGVDKTGSSALLILQLSPARDESDGVKNILKNISVTER